MGVFDDGSGAALYVSGFLRLPSDGKLIHVARWDGTSWSAVGLGTNERVFAWAVFDDGSGPCLYGGGVLTAAEGVPASRIARWNGEQWSPLGNGITGLAHSVVTCLAVYDDGTGPALYVGGRFTKAGTSPASNLARWDGTDWSAVGEGLSGTVLALATFDDGNGEALYAGGVFTVDGGAPGNFIVRWDGTGFSPLSGETNGAVFCLEALSGDEGDRLYVGGRFTTAGGLASKNIALWDGAAWSAVGAGLDKRGGLNGSVEALTFFDDGSGAALYAAGDFVVGGDVQGNAIARWDYKNWSSLNCEIGGFVEVLAVFDDGKGPSLYLGGPLDRYLWPDSR
jgi:hypothetical protein